MSSLFRVLMIFSLLPVVSFAEVGFELENGRILKVFTGESVQSEEARGAESRPGTGSQDSSYLEWTPENLNVKAFAELASGELVVLSSSGDVWLVASHVRDIYSSLNMSKLDGFTLTDVATDGSGLVYFLATHEETGMTNLMYVADDIKSFRSRVSENLLPVAMTAVILIPPSLLGLSTLLIENSAPFFVAGSSIFMMSAALPTWRGALFRAMLKTGSFVEKVNPFKRRLNPKAVEQIVEFADLSEAFVSHEKGLAVEFEEGGRRLALADLGNTIRSQDPALVCQNALKD
ncbi:MAG: hypothetical protein AAF202_08960 [Pseudomonadota bacterium]